LPCHDIIDQNKAKSSKINNRRPMLIKNRLDKVH
jgi:hypothetical protein